MAAILSVLMTSVRKHGPWMTIGLVGKNLVYEFRRYLDGRFDRKHGTDTCDRIELAQFDIVGDNRAHGVYYEPTSASLFDSMMKSLRSEIPYQDFVFIDYGSGKGRTLLMASDYPFKSVIGVEFARELHQIAERNIAIYGNNNTSRQQCRQLSSVHSDAGSFEPPASNLLVYFYNPFRREVMSKVLEHLAKVVRRHDLKVALIYLNPLSCDLVERCGLFVRHREIALPHDYSRDQQRKCFVYFNWPESTGTKARD